MVNKIRGRAPRTPAHPPTPPPPPLQLPSPPIPKRAGAGAKLDLVHHHFQRGAARRSRTDRATPTCLFT